MKGFLFIFFLLFGIFACKEKEVVQAVPIYDSRTTRVGIYKVYSDTAEYYIQVKALDSATIWNINYWLKIENVLNKFPVVYYPVRDIKNQSFENRVGVYDMNDSLNERIPSIDKYGNRWLIYSDSYEENGIQYNRISNDTLRLYLYMTNIKYRIEDGVPYEERYVKIEAVKVK